MTPACVAVSTSVGDCERSLGLLLSHDLLRQDLQRDVAAEAGVGGAVDLSHPARADGGLYAVVRERPAGQEKGVYGQRAGGSAPRTTVSSVTGIGSRGSTIRKL